MTAPLEVRRCLLIAVLLFFAAGARADRWSNRVDARAYALSQSADESPAQLLLQQRRVAEAAAAAGDREDGGGEKGGDGESVRSAEGEEDTWSDDDPYRRCSTHPLSPASLVPGLSDPSPCLHGLSSFPSLLSSLHSPLPSSLPSSSPSSPPSPLLLACVAQRWVQPWMGIEGVGEGQGMGHRGMVAHEMLQEEGTLYMLMSCCAHVRIVKGRIFFRYGSFRYDWYRMRRFALSLLAIQDAILEYGLQQLSVEFFLNTCDHPISAGSARADFRAGLPVFSPQGMPGSLDILYPDPLDLSEQYMHAEEDAIPWQQKQSKAVFRGGATNFKVRFSMQWRGSPRFRLHQMSKVRPDLLDAAIMKMNQFPFTKRLAADGIVKGRPMNASQMQAFKYNVVADGGAGTCRTCGVLASKQAMVRQYSEYYQFFDPLLCPLQHYLPTARLFSDLFKRIQWAQQHDRRVQHMVQEANSVARLACTWHGRTLFWAILLVKYAASAMEAPHLITAPNRTVSCRKSEPVTVADIEKPPAGTTEVRWPEGWPPKCGEEEERVRMPCVHFCSGVLRKDKWVWLGMGELDGLKDWWVEHKRRLAQTGGGVA